MNYQYHRNKVITDLTLKSYLTSHFTSIDCAARIERYMKRAVGAGIILIAGLLFFCLFLATRDYEPKELRAVPTNVTHQMPPLSWKSVHHLKQEEPRSPSLYLHLPSAFQRTPFSKRDVNGVEKFVFFVGYPRSGHSIIGSMMDAHPDIVIAHEFKLFTKWHDLPELLNKSYLFNALYQDSYQDAKNGWRSFYWAYKSFKGYALNMSSSWQGRFRRLRVIGDKSGGLTAMAYSESSQRACRTYEELVDTVKVPIHTIHVVRNPYDMIATEMLYSAGMHGRATVDHPYRINVTQLQETVQYVSSLASAVQGMIENCHLENILEIHHADHVKDPKATLQQICDFLDVECPEDYLQECDDKTFKQLSKTRELVVWNPEAHTLVKAMIKRFPFFHRYSTAEDYYPIR